MLVVLGSVWNSESTKENSEENKEEKRKENKKIGLNLIN